MRPSYPYRGRALVYISIPIILIVLGAGASVRSNAYSSSSAMNSGLSTTAGLSFGLFAVFVIPFLSFARKYWQAERIDSVPSVAVPGAHSLSVRYADPASGMLAAQRSAGILSWDNSTKTMSLTAGSDPSSPQEHIFESAYGSIEKFDINLGAITIKVSGKTYRCTVSRMSIISAYAGAGAAAGNLLAASIALRKAGASELVARLRAEAVPATYNEIKKGFEYSLDTIFAVLFIGMLSLAFFTM